MGPPLAVEVFISYASEDFEFATQIVTALENRGLQVFFAPKSVNRADWQQAIGVALKRCDWFLAVLSPSAAKSTWMIREVQFALTESRLEGRIVPVLARSCTRSHVDEISWVLRLIQQIDFTIDFETGMETLSRRLALET